ncbi:hypothetical protein GCM10027435_08400 [Haloparvum alkalitolerans]|uniref:hypothetical protein n=1 Tax=Haloparvum alkalitolerans TaxID=1042953 RepID=UPI003CE705EB
MILPWWAILTTGIAILVLVILFLGLRLIFNSTQEAAVKTFTILFIAILFPLGWITKSVKLVGRIFPVSEWSTTAFEYYPGIWFGEKVRADFVDRGEQYLNSEVVQLEKERDEKQLRDYIEKTHEVSGRLISNGEAVFAFSIAIAGVFSGTPGYVMAALSVGLLIIVAARLTTMESLLYDIPKSGVGVNRLEMILAWNEGIVNNDFLLRNVLILRIMYDVDGRLYEHYLYSVMDKSVAGVNMSKKGTVHNLLRPFITILEARMRDVSPRELSNEKYGENVLENLRTASIDDSESN